MTKDQLIEEAMRSGSLLKLRNINDSIKERHFHEHTHILYDIRTLLGNETKNYVEIGSYVGSSASLIAQNPFPTNIFCIDPLNLPKTHYRGALDQRSTLLRNFKANNPHDQDMTIIQSLSNDSGTISSFADIGIDILFIDGDHSFGAVTEDFRNYQRFVNKGGFIVFDDYLDSKHSPRVRKAVDYLSQNGKFKGYEIIGSIQNAVSAWPTTSMDNMSNEYILRKEE